MLKLYGALYPLPCFGKLSRTGRAFPEKSGIRSLIPFLCYPVDACILSPEPVLKKQIYSEENVLNALTVVSG